VPTRITRIDTSARGGRSLSGLTGGNDGGASGGGGLLGGLNLSGKTSLLGGSGSGSGGGAGGLLGGLLGGSGSSRSGSGGGGINLAGKTSLLGGLTGGGSGGGSGGGLLPGLPDPTQVISGIRGFLETISRVIQGVEGFKRSALQTGVGTLVSLQQVVDNPGLQQTFDRGSQAIGGIIQAAPDLARSQRNLVRTAMCQIVCALVPEGEVKDNCERLNCQASSGSSSSSSDYGDYGDYGDFEESN